MKTCGERSCSSVSLDLSARQRWLVSFVTQPPVGIVQVWSLWRGENPLLLQGIETWFLSR
jgi:hypothetical protein